MIRARGPVAGAVAIAVLATVFGQRSADPAVADPVAATAIRAAMRDEVSEAASALAALEVRLDRALAAAREASARIVTGEDPPTPHIEEAAMAVRDAVDDARAAAAALGAVAGTLPSGRRPAAPTTPEELRAIAAQLEALGPAAAEFAARRSAAAAVNEGLARALGMLEEGDAESALVSVEQLRRAHDDVSTWDPAPPTLRIWLDTTRAVIDAVEDLAGASGPGDAAAAAEATERFEALAEQAREADLGLRIAISEGGTSVISAPLQRLAQVLRRIESARSALASILQATPVSQSP